VEAIKYHMDQMGCSLASHSVHRQSQPRARVLNRRRSLTLKMIWRLHEGLGIPAESLIKGAGAGRLRLRGSAPGAAGSENRIMAQAMNFGTFDDIVVLEQTVGKNRLVKVMLRARTGLA
jgi:hypothetical protein